MGARHCTKMSAFCTRFMLRQDADNLLFMCPSFDQPGSRFKWWKL
jgi:hypothetical protein